MSISVRILIVEDRASDAELMLHELRKAGFEPEWQRVETEPDYLAGLATNPDLILADWSLPQFSGLRALQILKERRTETPFIIVSGSIGEESAVQAMRQGAADYLMKERLGRLGQAVRLALEDKQLRDEHKQAEEQLRASELRYRRLFEAARDGILILDAETGIVKDVNPFLVEMLGIQQAEIIGKELWELGFFKDTAFNKAKFLELQLEGYIRYEDLPLETSNGRNFQVEFVSNVYLVNHAKVIQCNIHDITERKKAQEKLAEERILLRTLIDNLPDRIYVMDVQGRKILSNLADWQAAGVKRMEDVLGKTDLDTFPPELAAGYQALNNRVIDSGTAVFNHEEPGLDPQGNPVSLSSSKVPLRDGQGKVVGLVGIGHDITERKLAEKRIQQQLEHLTAISGIDRVITANFDLKLSLSEILIHVTKELGVDAADILLLNPHLQILEYAAEQGFRTKSIKKAMVRLGESYAGRAALQRQLVQIPNLKDEPHNSFLTTLLAGEDFVCYFGLPLVIKGQVKGILEIFHRATLEPDAEWFDFLNSLAGQTAIAIENSTLFDSLQRSNSELILAYDATIEGWSHALDLRDKETEGHTLRVAEMTMKLAGNFGLSEEDIQQVRWGALLHDIGKMGVPDGILLKPGPLTDEEWVLMKKHPAFAYEMLAPIHYLHLALDIPYCHHEKWDGSGYPRGLKGEQIPLPARIFAVVDVWDALTSDRPYRKAWTEEEALEHIRAEAGTHFDPGVVEKFLAEKG